MTDELGEFLVEFEREQALVDAVPRARPPASPTRGPVYSFNEAARYLELKVKTFKRLLAAGLIVESDFGREMGTAKKYWYQDSLDAYHSPIIPENAHRIKRDGYGRPLERRRRGRYSDL